MSHPMPPIRFLDLTRRDVLAEVTRLGPHDPRSLVDLVDEDAARALWFCAYDSPEQIRKVSDGDLLALPGMDKERLARLRRYAKERE